MKALSATGFWNQLYKVSHFFYLASHFIPFLYNCRASVTDPRIFGFLKSLKQNEAKDLPIGTAGFCWGALPVSKACSNQAVNKLDDGTRVTDCGFFAHPSRLTFPGDLESIVLPLSVAAAEHDPMMGPEQAKQTEEILKAKTEKMRDQGIEHEFVMYGGVHHVSSQCTTVT